MQRLGELFLNTQLDELAQQGLPTFNFTALLSSQSNQVFDLSYGLYACTAPALVIAEPSWSFRRIIVYR